jgi:hypothetical protein
MAMVLNVIILIIKNYVTISMLTSTPWSILFFNLFFYKNYFYFILFFGQTKLMLSTTLGYFLPLL